MPLDRLSPLLDAWRRRGSPLVMGVLNVTPDSFSDGGEFSSLSAAQEHALRMIADGAELIDVGPESTRPGAQPVPADQQIRRALPVIEAIRQADEAVCLSVDTRLAPVAEAAFRVGADLINDTSALRDDPALVEVVAEAQAGVVLMHRRGTPLDMQRDGGPHYSDVVAEISEFLLERRAFACRAGISPGRIILDPGLGFGKRFEHNLKILGHLKRFTDLGSPILVGASRKRFIGQILEQSDPKKREAGSLACAVLAAVAGAAIIRAHDVASTVEALRVVSAVRGSP